MWLVVYNFFKSYRYFIFGALVVIFVVVYSWYHDIAVAKALKPSVSRSAVGDGSTIRKVGLINF